MNKFTEKEHVAANQIRMAANLMANDYAMDGDFKPAIVALLLQALIHELDSQGIDKRRFLTESEE